MVSRKNSIDNMDKLDEGKQRLHISILFPVKPCKKKYSELVEALQLHYAPKRSVITEWYHFYREIRTVKTHRDRFVCVLSLDTIRWKLLLDDTLTFGTTVLLAQ
ncbi:hypothetical protein PR048_030997 [Dryococelus australis]|uniref:Uncharacterized protein n=1 Tax=Dryococelus australis TaxID=614101 RepID=A0ABQ9G421_9NEOP|nr:hypothetical protein PR048_030997 [Dryococelus australis]